ncbi:MAG: MFS transporter [Hyphomicrobiaceae bacterium]|nr:MFS transporter [Hyphomicrobiaceae bacterium]
MNGWRDLFRSEGAFLLAVYGSGIWLFAADGLMVATLMPVIVPDLGGAELIGWAGALFQAFSIVAGAFSVFLVRKWRISRAFLFNVAGLLVGCLVSAAAPDMLTFQIGRLFQAFCGGALVSLANIGITRAFAPELRVRAFAVISVIWGLAAFGAPLIGALFAQFATWRTAFLYAAAIAVGVGIAAIFAYRGQKDGSDDSEPSEERFPLTRMALITAGVTLVATASLVNDTFAALTLIGGGIVASVLYARRDRISGPTALLPAHAYDPKTPIGAMSAFVFFGSIATVAMGVFGPIILADAYQLPPLEIGYLLFLAAGGWTLTAAVLSGVAGHQEPAIIRAAALVIVLSSPAITYGFATDSLWAIGLGLFMDGAGFGACWGLLLRRSTQHPDVQENARISSAVNTIQRAGLALGAAFLSVLCNRIGFSDAMTPEVARSVGFWMMLVSSVLGVPALVAAFRFARVPEEAIHAI